MEQIYMDGRDGDSSFTASRLKMEFEKMSSEIPLDLDVKQANTQTEFEKMKLRSSEFLFESPKFQKMLDSIEGTIMAKTLLKNSLLLQLGTLDNDASQVRSRSVNTRKTKSSELGSYPLGLHYLQEPKFEVTPFRKRRTESSVFEKMLVIGSSTNLKCSPKSTASAHRTVSKGTLHCVRKSGIPYFVFSLDDDRDEVYVANPQTIKSSEDKAVDYMYMFRSTIGGKKESRNQDNNALGFVGKMKVSSSLVLNSNRSKCIETEFVLFGSHDDLSREMQIPTSTPTKSKGLSKMMAKILRSTHSFKRKSTKKIRVEDFLRETFVGELSDIDKPPPMNYLAHDFVPNLELAAIVVNDYEHYSNKEASVGGWGLKFLEKVEVDRADTSPESSFVSKSCEESCMGYRRESSRNMNVLIPSGFHGGPISRIGGPSSLTERWKSGGHCDCGGWDIGCPLTVLNNNSVYSEASPLVELQEDSKLVNLCIEGANPGEPILRIVDMNDGLYFVYFQSTLSALQSFSIGVAIIHTQSPDLYPKL